MGAGAITAFRHLLKAELAVRGVARVSGYELGCFSFGYLYNSPLESVSGQPLKLFVTPEECQAWCHATHGCGHFTFLRHENKCWLAAESAPLEMATQKGYVSGPA